MGRDGDGDGAVEEGYSFHHRIYGLAGVSWEKFWNCCTFYIITFHVLCSMFLVATTLLVCMLF